MYWEKVMNALISFLYSLFFIEDKLKVFQFFGKVVVFKKLFTDENSLKLRTISNKNNKPIIIISTNICIYSLFV